MQIQIGNFFNRIVEDASYCCGFLDSCNWPGWETRKRLLKYKNIYLVKFGCDLNSLQIVLLSSSENVE